MGGGKSVNSILPQPLFQFLHPGSCLEFLPWLLSMDCDSLFPKLLRSEFNHSNRKQTETLSLIPNHTKNFKSKSSIDQWEICFEHIGLTRWSSPFGQTLGMCPGICEQPCSMGINNNFQKYTSYKCKHVVHKRSWLLSFPSLSIALPSQNAVSRA